MRRQVRRSIAIAVTLCFALLPLHGRAAVNDIQPRITNISVAVSGGSASYYICVLAPVPPAAGAVTVQGPGGNKQAPFQPLTQGCGPSSSLMQATFPNLPAGRYLFQAACVLLGADRSGNASPPVPCLVRNVGFVSNFSGLSVATSCQVDFDPSQPAVPRSCASPGVAGSFAAVGGSPAPSASPTVQASRVNTTTPAPKPGATFWTGPASSHAFFAEGYTGAGYHEYLSLLNPHAQSITAAITLYRKDGASRTVQLGLAGLTRHTVDVSTIAPQASTAARIAATGGVVVERALYTPDGSGHIVAGAGLPARRWYVAEGYVGRNFADALRIFNPYDSTALLTLTAYGSDGKAYVSRRTLKGGTRQNIALDDVAPTSGSSLVIDSSERVVVESIVRQLPDGATSAAMALSSPSRSWYFPDGSTQAGNQEYIALFNPGSKTSTVQLRAILGTGLGKGITVRVRPHAHMSVAIHRYMHTDNLALAIQADRPVVAQEARYLSGGGISLVNGVVRPSSSWGLAEGYSGGGFREWITVLNPGARAATVTVRLVGRQGVDASLTLEVPAQQLSRLLVNGLLPRGSVAAVIASDSPIVAGRTLTFSNGRGLSTTTGVAIGAH